MHVEIVQNAKKDKGLYRNITKVNILYNKSDFYTIISLNFRLGDVRMKFKEFDEYHRYYCGLCRALKEDQGAKGQLSLSYDMTFLVLLLTGLYEPSEPAWIAAHARRKS